MTSAGSSSAGARCSGHEREWLDGIIFDITDRRRFEESARRAEAEAAVAREVAESRRRMMCAADEARRRIERDLHDGAQQSLVCALIMLRARPRAPRDDLERARSCWRPTEGHLEQGLKDLRDLAHGIHPSQLSARGVAAALGEVAARTPVPVRVVDDLGPAAAERCRGGAVLQRRRGGDERRQACGAERGRGARRAAERRVFVQVRDDGVGGASSTAAAACRGLSDRLATLGGAVVHHEPARRGHQPGRRDPARRIGRAPDRRTRGLH